MDLSIFLIVVVAFVAVAIVVVMMCDRGSDRRRKSANGYDGRDSQGWSFGGPNDQSDFFGNDD